MQPNKAQEVIDFIELLHLTEDFYGQPFKLEPWQKEVINTVYGTVNPDGYRQYRRAYLEIPKKNGKTTLIAALGLYHLVCDMPGGQIFCCAAEKEQAGISYRTAKAMIEQDESLAEMLKVVDSKKEIYNRDTGTFLKVLSAEAYSKHGLNPSITIFDELHAQPNRDLWDTMSFGASSTRKQPLQWTITTSGDDPDRKSIGWEQHELAQKIIADPSLDPTMFARIYGAPDDADIYDESVWYQCNPSLGVTISVETVRSEAASARNSESAERLFRWLRLNQWIATKRIGWLPVTLWDKTVGKWTRADLKGRDCYMGLDLSSTNDLTAAAVLFPPRGDEPWRFFVDAWIPEDNMREREERDHVPFAKWVKDGHVLATPGECVDYATVAKHIDRMMQEYNVIYLCADQWRLEYMLPLMDCELSMDKVVKIPQTIEGTSPAISEIERLMLAGEIEHEENPCGRWAFGNVRVAIDGNENKKFHKGRSIDRIDPIMALVDAMAGAIRLENRRSVYETRGLRTL